MKQLGVITLLALLSSGCVVAGYSSGRGWFIWPGLGTLLVIALLIFLLRRR